MKVFMVQWQTMSSTQLPPHAVPGYPMEHRGWNIWLWTGWKDEGKFIIDAAYVRARARMGIIPECSLCHEILGIGQLARRTQDSDQACHWKCLKGSNDVPSTLTGQWLAEKDGKYVYASTPGGQGLYIKGAMFAVAAVDGQVLITENTPQLIRDEAQRECFERLKGVIDKYENNNS